VSTEAIVLFLAGLIWPVVFQAIGRLGLHDRPAQWVAVGFCFVMAAVAHALSGADLSPEGIINAGSPVALLSLVVYRQVIKPWVETH